jgi:hypothetical protein
VNHEEYRSRLEIALSHSGGDVALALAAVDLTIAEDWREALPGILAGLDQAIADLRKELEADPGFQAHQRWLAGQDSPLSIPPALRAPGG